MKKKSFVVCTMLLLISFIFVGCEKAVKIRAATFSDITAAGSENYVVRVSYSEDKRLKGKGSDVQIKFSKTGTIKLGREGQEKFNYEIEDYDEWYSLTHIFNEADTTNVRGDRYEKIEDALTKTYIINSDQKMKITFRVVVGEIEENSTGDGEILVGSQAISDNFVLKIE